jgi:hypothetical protein
MRPSGFFLSGLFFAAMVFGQSMPSGAVLHIEARSAVISGAIDPDRVSTCRTGTCRANEVEESTAANSFCDVAPADQGVAGALGLCTTGCPRFLTDLGPNAGRRSTGAVEWDIGTDDAEKPCLVLDCLNGQACLQGVLTQTITAGNVWDTGASLELQIPDIITLAADFSLISLIRLPASLAESQCLFGDSTHHLCIESTRAIRLRANGFNSSITATAAIPLPGTANRYDWHLLEVYRASNAVTVSLNGIDITSGTPSTSASFAISNFMSYFKGAGAFGGQAALFAFFDRSLSTGERRQMRVYVGDQFGAGPLANRFHPI